MATKITLITTDAKIDDMIASISKRGKSIQKDIHRTACSIVRRWHESSDVSVAVRQMNALLAAIPSMARANAFKAWVEAYATFVWDADNSCFAYHAKRTKISLDDAKAACATPFWEFKKEPEYKPMNLDDMIAALIARADKRRQDGLQDGDVVDADKIKALKAIIA
jgi:hypothetical protein|tara:strand:+ start:142 stop:639 length:498 start_codon:yes stop_codon:yes gene_type:complete